MRNSWVLLVTSLIFLLAGCRGCVEQHDPRPAWDLFNRESAQSNKKQPMLTEDGQMPTAVVAQVAGTIDPIDEKYAQLCAGCHGEKGEGNGPAGLALNPKPRNFVTWNDPSITDEHIYKAIAEGGAAVGKSALMAAWGGILSPEDINGMVKKIRAWKK